jgi:hypothetical protein
VGDELTAVVVAELEAAGDARAESAEAGTHTLTQWLERLKAGRPAGGVDANAFRRAGIDRDEDRSLPLGGHEGKRKTPVAERRRVKHVMSRCCPGMSPRDAALR